jgi:hypothetical protein
MLKFKILVPALFLSATMLTPVSAAPVTPDVSLDANIIQVQDNGRRYDGRRDGMRRGDRGRDYRRGYRRGPPRGWRRYSRRPRDYRTRGCILFGPIWFCP